MRKPVTALLIAAFMLVMPDVTLAELPEQIASVAPVAKRKLDVRNLKISEKSGRVSVTLPDGSVLRFVPVTVRERQGVTTLRGVVDGARLLLTADGHNAFGFISTTDANYRITTVGNHTYVIDFAALPPASGVSESLDDVRINQEFVEQVRKRMDSARVRGKVAAEAADAPFSVIDIAMFMDPALLEVYSAQALRTMAQARIDFTNEAFITNHIGAELNLVLVEMSGTPLVTGTARLDPYATFASDTENAARAAAFGADLRHLLYSQHDGIDYCGKAGLVDSSGASGAQCGESTVAHELGHNFGAHHDRPHADGNVDLPISAYNYGLPCGGDATLMSYVGAAPLGYYSDPTQFNKGEACGVAFDQPSGAHNAHVIDVMRTQLESFQAPQTVYGTVSLPPGPIAMNEWDAPLDITVTRDGDLSHAASVEIAGIDDTAYAGRDYVPILSRLEFAEGETSKVVRIEPIDDDGFEQDQSFRLVLRYPLGLAVVGSPLTVTLHSDDPDLGKAVLATDAVSAQENQGTVNLAINRVGDSSGTLVIPYSTADGTCVAGECYEAASGSVTFAPGENSKIVQVRIIDDTHWDPTEYRSFTFNLLGENIGEFPEAVTATTVKVFNDDPDTGKAQFLNVSGSINEASGSGRFTVLRIGNSENTLKVGYETRDGTAHAGTHYTAASGILTFAPGVTSTMLEIPITDNSAVDGARDFSIQLTGEVGTPSTMSITIIDNDKQQASRSGGGGGGGMEPAWLLTLGLLMVGRTRRRSDGAQHFQPDQ